MAVGGIRPCDLLGYKGSIVERLLFDSEVLTAVAKDIGPPQSTYEMMMRRRALKGYPQYMS